MFWQPEWLDILSDNWRSHFIESDGKLRAVWPYVPIRKGGFHIASWPPCTPYLGPLFLTKRVLPLDIPPKLSYVNCTFSNPAFAWVFGRKARAMATQKLSLPAKPFSADLRRRLKNAAGEYIVSELDTTVVSDKIKYVRENWSAPIPPDAERIFQEATRAGTGSVLALFSDEGDQSQPLAYLGVVWDKNTTYLLFITRSPSAPSATAQVLLSAAIDAATGRNCIEFDFCAGFLKGVRDFFSQFGARPEWYGQLRIAKGPIMRSLEFMRSRWSTSRI